MTRTLIAFGLVLSALFLTGCGDSPTAPSWNGCKGGCPARYATGRATVGTTVHTAIMEDVPTR